jgi:hypothetical protein
MKERQAQLEENIVAENLASVYRRIEPYSKPILGAVVALVVVLIGFGFYRSEQTAKRSDATFSLLMEDPEVALRYPETPAAAWSLLFQANDNLAQGINALYQDRDEAETLLSQAKDQFQDAAAASEETLLLSRANFGRGMAAESLGQIDEAIEAYEQTVAANESEQMVEVAQERIDRLSNSGTKEFIAWFSEQDFAPADPSLPPELPGASSLPDLPDLDLPDLNLEDSAEEAAAESDSEMSESPQPPAETGLELPDRATQPAEESEPAETKADAASATDDATDDATADADKSDDAESPAATAEPSAAESDTAEDAAAENSDGDASQE